MTKYVFDEYPLGHLADKPNDNFTPDEGKRLAHGTMVMDEYGDTYMIVGAGGALHKGGFIRLARRKYVHIGDVNSGLAMISYMPHGGNIEYYSRLCVVNVELALTGPTTKKEPDFGDIFQYEGRVYVIADGNRGVCLTGGEQPSIGFGGPRDVFAQANIRVRFVE